jgi:hypothetical protein
MFHSLIPLFRIRIVMVGLAWLVLSGLAMAATTEPSWENAQQQEAIVHDAGPVFPYTEVAHEFTMVNDSSQEWHFLDKRTSCSCTLTSRLPPILRPGERAGFHLSFHAGTDLGIEQASGWILKQVEGKVWRCPFTLQCRVADYLDLPQGVVRVDAAAPMTLTIKRGGHPDRWNRVQVDAGTWADRFKATLEPQPDGTWVLSLAAVAGKHRGDFNGRLTCTFFDGDRPLDHRQTLDVATRLPGSLVSSPSSVLVGGVLLGQEREMTVVLRPQTGRPLPTIASVECLDPERMTVTLTPQDQTLRMAMRFRAVGATGKASSRVILHLDDGECFHVPYIAAIAKPTATPAP